MTDRIMCENRYWRQPVLDPKNYKRVIYDPGMVTRIILNRPRYLNALSHALLTEVRDALDRASEDDNCRVIVISGAGTCFSSGDDNTGLTPESAPTLWDGDDRAPGDYNGTVRKLIEEYGSEAAVWRQYNIEHDQLIGYQNFRYNRVVPKPTIAMVQRYCIANGLGTALSMDIIFAAEDCLFMRAGGMPDSTPAGIINMGTHKALELAYEHRFITAREALELRLINRIFPDYETLEKETMAFAYRVAYESPLALRRTKEHFLNTLDFMGYTMAVEMERTPFRSTWRHDAEEGHRMRYEGKGRARTPVGLANLKAKLVSEGAEVPKHLEEALARAVARDDKATWQRVLHQEWRSADRVGRTDASAKAYNEMRAEDERKMRAECSGRGLNYEDMLSPWEKIVRERLEKAKA